MNIVPIVIAVVCILLVILFFLGKGAFLIAGYNTSSKEEKEQYNEKALYRFMGTLMFAIAGCLIVAAFSWLGYLLTFAAAMAAAVYANTGNRFKM